MARYPDIKDKNRRAYAAMITSLDDQVGRIVAALEKKGLRDNTLIVFTTDNGGATSALFATGAHSPEERKTESGGLALGKRPPASNGSFRAVARVRCMKASKSADLRLLSGRYTVGVALPFAYMETTVKFETKEPKRKVMRTLSDSSFGFSDKPSSPKIASKSG